ncbi:hypothetical protein RND71_012732 [Anisodus tanguticus]|uniref:Uncharacterized protein n=1 Tax=Anisodus tanguticus TaxID=243964 RepID=A0AAE1SF73_9SOLA|nr:hypothetical protein RND71_012732 [Anisodus tanguticus]
MALRTIGGMVKINLVSASLALLEERREQRRPVGAKTLRHKLDDLHRHMSWSERTQRSNP